MSLEEMREFVRQTREDRKISKVRTSEKKVRAKRSDKSKATATKALAKMSDEELAILLGELEDGSPEGPDR